MANTQTAAAQAPAVDEAALEEMNRLLFDAPIEDLAQSQGISIEFLWVTIIYPISGGGHCPTTLHIKGKSGII